jgi:FlaA1/EpsC-like NDP-sugar epimerase
MNVQHTASIPGYGGFGSSILKHRFLRAATLDTVIICAAYAIAYLAASLEIVVREAANGDGVTYRLLPENSFAALFLVFWVATIVSLGAFGVYRRIWSQTSGYQVTVIIGAVTVAVAAGTIALVLLTPGQVPLVQILFGSLISLSGLVMVRYRSRLISGLFYRVRASLHIQPTAAGPRVLIVGAGESGQMLALRFRNHAAKRTGAEPEDGARPRREDAYQLVGFIDDDASKHGMLVEGLCVYGGREAIEEVAAEHAIDLIVIAIHNIAGADMREIIGRCEKTGARIQMIPDVLAMMRPQRAAPLLRDIQPEDLLGRSTITRHEAVDLGAITGRVVLITGAAGSIGSELSRQMLDYAPTRLLVLDNNESGLYDLANELKRLNPAVAVEQVLADITQRERIAAVMERFKPQVVFHAAAYKHVPMLENYPDQAVRVNIGGTRNVAELAMAHGAERFVLISTDKAVNPSSVMGASKRACELLLHALTQQPGCTTLFTAVRFGNVLNSRGSVVPAFNAQIDDGGPVQVTHQEMTRFFMTIPEAVNLILHAACLSKSDDIFILQMGEVVRIVDLAERMIRMRGLRPYKDIDIVFTGVRPGEKMHEELYTEHEHPEQTLHPHIIKLHTWNEQFSAAAFLDDAARILHEPLVPVHALARLRALTDEPLASLSPPQASVPRTRSVAATLMQPRTFVPPTRQAGTVG